MSKVDDWIACDLRYVAETKLNRLTDDELAKLYFGLGKKHSLEITTISADRDTMIGKLMTMKREIQIAYSAAVAMEKAQTTAEATKAVEAIFETGPKEEGEEAEEAEAPAELTEEEAAAKKDREARAAAFIQLAAAVAPPDPPPTNDADSELRPSSPVTVDTHHRLRVCSFNACKMRLGNANKAYAEASECGDKDEYEGTHKGAELAQKWLTLAARMADFDVILLQEVPGTEKVMNEKVETFAAMLDIATEEGQFWTAVSSQKSGKDGKVVGPGAEVHVCFVKSPLAFKSWNTLRKVGSTELDYAPLQVVVHDPRFADPADQTFVITSVHLPPSKRVDARDSQIAALLRNYSAPDTSEYRMQLPFKPNKETKTSPTHIIAGDFNTYPGNEQYNMLSSGFVSKIPKNASTTSGHQNFDNVLVDTLSNDRLLIGGGILQLKNPHNAAKGEIGLSDHYPVFVEVCEVQKTGKPLPVVESEFVAEEEAAEEAPPPLEPVPEEEEEEVVASRPQGRNYDDAGSVGSATSNSDALTDGPPELPRVDDEEEKEETVVKEVVRAAMEKVTQSVVETAAAADPAPEPTPDPEAPPAAAQSTEAQSSASAPAPLPAPDASPTPDQASLDLDRELAEVLGEDEEETSSDPVATDPEPVPERHEPEALSPEEPFVLA